ncbi:hypothetical protein [Bacillus cereus]|uniref:hypothetical protein n=1 Tax=Bacillus cereus TaxID=1396 RepID=UPI00032F4C11|nr:hypothetical protein [Bacillus cereus]EOO44398.1 hypothetical protein ICK_06173 [Bacillus cereus BAG1X2-2]
MSRKRLNPSHSLGQFIYGIYDYHHDRGMPQKTAKARMIDNTLEACVNVMRKEEEIPDQMIVLMAQWMSQSLNNRGIQITKEIKQHQNKGTYKESMLQPLHDLRPTKDAIDHFIETYTGWSEPNGKSKNEG